MSYPEGGQGPRNPRAVLPRPESSACGWARLACRPSHRPHSWKEQVPPSLQRRVRVAMLPPRWP